MPDGLITDDLVVDEVLTVGTTIAEAVNANGRYYDNVTTTGTINWGDIVIGHTIDTGTYVVPEYATKSEINDKIDSLIEELQTLNRKIYELEERLIKPVDNDELLSIVSGVDN